MRRLILGTVLLFLGLSASGVPAESRDPAGGASVLFRGTLRHSGGWGLITPGLVIGAAVGLGHLPGGKRTSEDAKDLLKKPRFWTGVAGSLIAAHLSSMLAASIPGGLFVRSLVAMSGGFLGWEIGTLNLGQTDWVSLGAQVLTSTLAFMAVQGALGPAGPVARAFLPNLAGVGAAILTGLALDRVRRQSLEPPLLDAPRTDLSRRRSSHDPAADVPGPGDDLSGARHRWKQSLEDVARSPDAASLRRLQEAEASYRAGLAGHLPAPAVAP